ncbi:COL21A1 [Branchiostoma lanceolatum]|uniref:COL21A1 protein n=1 Tax=Branchiostoma lanceolatum TaxID=7740 RepID=A0A8J9YZE6_BRALA|nr:COL21A1 [Branchiostoma lanceolatum]
MEWTVLVSFLLLSTSIGGTNAQDRNRRIISHGDTHENYGKNHPEYSYHAAKKQPRQLIKNYSEIIQNAVQVVPRCHPESRQEIGQGAAQGPCRARIDCPTTQESVREPPKGRAVHESTVPPPRNRSGIAQESARKPPRGRAVHESTVPPPRNRSGSRPGAVPCKNRLSHHPGIGQGSTQESARKPPRNRPGSRPGAVSCTDRLSYHPRIGQGAAQESTREPPRNRPGSRPGIDQGAAQELARDVPRNRPWQGCTQESAREPRRNRLRSHKGIDKAQPCSVDTVFVADRSSSIRGSGFDLAKRYIDNFSGCFNGQDIGVGAITYDCVPRTSFPLGDYTVADSYTLMYKIYDMQYTGGTTRTALAISYMKDTANFRDGVHRVAVIITDGHIEGSMSELVAKADMARDAGITLYVVANGALVDNAALDAIAGGPNNVFSIGAPCDLATRILQLCGPPV